MLRHRYRELKGKTDRCGYRIGGGNSSAVSAWVPLRLVATNLPNKLGRGLYNGLVPPLGSESFHGVRSVSRHTLPAVSAGTDWGVHVAYTLAMLFPTVCKGVAF